ncbi:hypothetical protein EYF80_031594 [Liparis tanakae]|uniref:Uncharacterized protein n=1 Tax=Liparis tanakae TaxID=230148 RepID=A0A4Z2GXX3_9TELE|nr:hypothetical protein EYF80_031594 [Liparis tanakae]
MKNKKKKEKKEEEEEEEEEEIDSSLRELLLLWRGSAANGPSVKWAGLKEARYMQHSITSH